MFWLASWLGWQWAVTFRVLLKCSICLFMCLLSLLWRAHHLTMFMINCPYQRVVIFAFAIVSCFPFFCQHTNDCLQSFIRLLYHFPWITFPTSAKLICNKNIVIVRENTVRQLICCMVMVYQYLDWPTPFTRSQGLPLDNACGHNLPRYWMSYLHDCPPSASERFPSPCGTRNSLPAEVTSSTSRQTFKTKLKSHLFLASFL